MLTFLFTFLPPLLILFYIINSDKFKEPTNLIIEVFIIGMLLIIPGGILNSIFIFSAEDPFSRTYLAGFTEETLKFIVLFFYVAKKSAFNEPMDAIVYGVLISLGFATYENYEYVYLFQQYPNTSVAILRSFTAIPMHAIAAILMGYHIGIYFFRGAKFSLLKAFLYPILFHGIYNFLVTVLGIFSVIWVLIMYIYARFLHGVFLKEQATKKSEQESKVR